MAVKRFLGQAGAKVQIDSINLGGTYVSGDGIVVTIGNSQLVVLLGSSQTTPAIAATVVKNAINARTIDENLQGAETRFNAGQALGEFRDVDAIIDPNNATKVLVRSRVPGAPFGTPSGGNLLVSTDSAAGTIARTSVQSASGPNHWDNSANWDSGTVPANGDTVVFKNSNVPVKYGLPNGSLEVTIEQWQSFTGWIGLPEINTDNAGGSYYEYRPQYVRLDDSGSGTSIAHRFGLGKDGNGSQLINVKHSTLECKVVVYNTGSPLVPGKKALNICCTANTSTLNVIGGWIDCSSQDGATSAFEMITCTGGDVRGVQCLTDSATLYIQGGSFLLGGTSDTLLINVSNGILRIESLVPATYIDHLRLEGGTVEYASSANINILTCNSGSFDARLDAGTFSISTNSSLRSSCKFLNPYDRITGVLLLNDEPSNDWQFGSQIVGKLLTLG